MRDATNHVRLRERPIERKEGFVDGNLRYSLARNNHAPDHQHTDDDRENDDADTEIGPEEVIQQRKAVDHRAHDYFEPENTEDFHLRILPFARLGARVDGRD